MTSTFFQSGAAQPDISQVNNEANALVGTALTSYGALPDPRSAVEAMMTGATPDVLGAMQSGNPNAARLLSASHIGGTPTLAAPSLLPSSDGMTMSGQDWSKHIVRIAAAKAGHEVVAGDKQWASFGDVPEANLSWARSVMQGNAATVKKWQNYLNSNGWTGANHLEISGVYDAHTDAAFRSFLVSRFVPQALYGKDEAQRNTTRSFLTALGVDPDSLASQMGRDPEFRTQVVGRWLHTIGPDTNARDSLDQFVDLYGQDSMPPALDKLRNDFWTRLGDSFGHIPILGNIASMPIDLAKTGHLGIDSLYKKTSDLEADLTGGQLNDAEKNALAPALQAAHNASGFLGFLDAWDRLRTKAVLGIGYFFGDAFSGKGVDNLFDAGNRAWKGADAHQDNLMAGFFGDQWVHDHPWLATFGNIVGNIADDPLTYLGGLGLAKVDMEALKEAPRLTQIEAKLTGGRVLSGGVSGARSAARFSLLTPTAIRDAIGQNRLGTHVLDAAIRPRDALRNETARLLGKDGVTTLDAAELLGETRTEKLPVLQQLLDEKDVGLRSSLLDKHYGWRVQTADHAFQLAQFRKSLAPDVWQRLDQGKQLHILSGALRQVMDQSPMENLQEPIQFAHSLKTKAEVLGMTSDEIQPILKLAISPEQADREEAILRFRDLEPKAMERRGVKLDAFDNFRNAGRRTRGVAEPDESRVAYAPQRDAQGRIVEGSTIDRRYTFDTGDPRKDEALTEHADHLRAGIEDVQRRVTQLRDGMVDELIGDTPITAKERAGLEARVMADPRYQSQADQLQRRVVTFRQELEALPGRKGAEGRVPAAAVSTQFTTWAKTRYTPYEVLAFTSKLRGIERLQQKLHVDAVRSTWQKLLLSNLRSSMRIDLGDEISRGFIDSTLDGGPLAGAKYLKDAMQAMARRGRMEALPEDLKFGIHDVLSGMHVNDHIPMEPGTLGYNGALRALAENHLGRAPETGVWLDAMSGGTRKGAVKGTTAAMEAGHEKAVAALSDWLRGDSAEAHEFLRREGVSATDDAKVRRVALGIHNNLLHFTMYQAGDPEREFIFKWLQGLQTRGKGATKGPKPISDRALGEFTKRNQLRPDVLPIVMGRRPWGQSENLVGRGFNQMTGWFHTHVTDAMVNGSRKHIYNDKIDQYKDMIRLKHSDWTDDQVANEARHWSGQWIKRNTYQGQRTLTATAMRNAFPFFGATANFNRFVLRQWAKHPWTLDPSLHVLQGSTAAQGQGGVHMPLPGVGGLLAKFGMSSGDDVTWDPGHAFFFTADGIGGFVPGLGPFFMTPLKHFASADPNLSDTLAQIPGFEFVGADTPLLPWAEQVVSGISMKLTGKPTLEGASLLGVDIGRPAGYYEKQTLEKERQQHAAFLEGQGPETTAASATQDVAGRTLATGLLGGLLPLDIRQRDPRAAALQPALQAWDQASTDADKDKVKAAFPDAAPLLEFYDSRTTSEQRDQLAALHPWVEAYSAGITASGAQGTTPGSEPSTRAYHQDIAGGRLRYLGSDEYIDKLQRNDEFTEAWSMYDVLSQRWNSYLIETGQSPSSKAASAWHKANIDPVLTQIASTHPNWAATFSKQQARDMTGLQQSTLPLRSLMTWEVIPQHNDFETQTTQAWRQALVWRDWASGVLRELIAAGASKAEKQQVLDQLSQGYAYLAQWDSGFAKQIGRYRYSTLDDLVTVDAEQALAPAA